MYNYCIQFLFVQVLETNISEIVSAFNEGNKQKKRSGAMATISGSGASVARDLGANLASTVTNTLQSTVSATFPTFRRNSGFNS